MGKKPSPKPGPDPERLKIAEHWEVAASKIVRAPKPKADWKRKAK